MFEVEAIVATDSGVLSALRISAPHTDTLPRKPALQAPQDSLELTLWRLAEDRDRRRRALAHAAGLGWNGPVHIEILAASAEDREVCTAALLADAHAARIKPQRIVLELSETEAVEDPAKLALATAAWRAIGFRNATRHFGSGLSGLGKLLRLEPDLVCLDGGWVRRVAIDPGTRIILAGVVSTCSELGCEVIADGVISATLSNILRELGIVLQSGTYFEPLLRDLSRAGLVAE